MHQIDPKDYIAFMGDTHMNARWIRAMLRELKDRHVSHVFQAGDYGFLYTSNFVKDVEESCEEYGIEIIFCDGNHDNHDLLNSLPRDDGGFGVLSPHVRFAPRAHRWSVWGKTFMALGGAESVDKAWRTPMVDWWPTERLHPSEAQRAVSGGPVDVMLAHDCPSRVPIPGITRANGLRYFPEEALRRADEHRDVFRKIVDQVNPAVYVHGHYHVDYGWVDPKTNTRYIGLNMDGKPFDRSIWVVRSPDELERFTDGQRRDGDSGDELQQ